MQLSQLLDERIERRLQNVWTAFPAEVVTVKDKTVDVVPKALVDGKKLPMLTDVRVVYPASSTARILFPIEEGDVVLVVCSKLPIGKSLSTKGPAEPGVRRSFSYVDAIAIPCIVTDYEDINIPKSEVIIKAKEVIKIESKTTVCSGTRPVAYKGARTSTAGADSHYHVIEEGSDNLLV